METTNTLYGKFMGQFFELPCEVTGLILESNQPHHIIYKSQSRLLTLVKLNIIVLTVEEHSLAHKNKAKFMQFIDAKYPTRIQELEDIKLEIRRSAMTPREIYDRFGT